jgi:hypothetical protein
MKTNELIGAIVQDSKVRGLSLGVRMAIALAVGGTVSTVLFGLGLGVRPDIAVALQTWRFPLKLAVVLLACILGLWATVQLARPDVNMHKVLAGLVIAPALLATAVGIDLLLLPPDLWFARAVGSNSRVCLAAIPLLSVVPLGALLLALRSGAPRSPPATGAVAGLLAGSIAASLYATHCIDDSPLFVALWYIPAIALMVGLGVIAGHRVLRW